MTQGNLNSLRIEIDFPVQFNININLRDLNLLTGWNLSDWWHNEMISQNQYLLIST